VEHVRLELAERRQRRERIMWEGLLDRTLRQVVRDGTLIVHMPSGAVRRFGSDGDVVTVRLIDPDLPRRILTSPDMALGEGYMDGTLAIEGDDLRGFLTLAIRNARRMWSLPWLKPVAVSRRMLRRAQQANPVPRARRNVAHHYDLSAELYDLFLDDDKQYSCGYFRAPHDTLEQAQAQKKALIARKLRLGPGMRVLDIGCGWGGLALTLARDHGARVVGVTLSEEQHRIAARRARDAGLGDRVEFRLTDYRHVSETFDRVVSVGMFEHVGLPHYREFFRTVHDRLAPDGVALIHTIGWAGPPHSSSRWIDRYIFPGGYVPSLSEMMAAVEHEDLFATDIEIWRLHYAETLRRWHDRFVANIERARTICDARFCRMWRYYLLASELTFRHNRQVVFQVQLAHRCDAVPLTRDYLFEESQRQGDMAAE
jgi:cyclopropane-fatty-acyl-phospholipid synthase